MADINQSLLSWSSNQQNTKNLKSFVGELNGILKFLKKDLDVKIFQNGNKVSISGDHEDIQKASNAIKIYMLQHQGSGTLQGNNTNGY